MFKINKYYVNKKGNQDIYYQTITMLQMHLR